MVARPPLIDLHRHLDGSVRLQTILELGQKHGMPLPSDTLEGLRPHVVVTTPQPGLVEFLAKFKWMTAVLADYDDCRRVARENVEDARREGIRYIELRFSPAFMADAHNLDPSRVTAAVIEGVREGQEATGVRAKLIGILTRTYGPVRARRELRALLDHKKDITALDLAGDEGNWPAELFVGHFKDGRDAGWHITVHAGEAAGAQSIVTAIEQLGATRIGHAVRAVEDAAVMDLLRERRIGIEANLTSNVQTSTVPDYASHPLKKFLEAGLLATINTDDPGISGIDLAYELDVAAPAAGLDEAQINQSLRNAWEIAFLDADEKGRLLGAG
ncbi:MAG: adenosine deaminase [Chthoniobacterales bacterium]|nr:adenosine deaminase [Chthoniobacterales bacterium]